MTTTVDEQGGNGSAQAIGRRGARDPAVAPPTRRVRVPELAAGVLLMVLFGLGAMLWYLSSVDRVPALAVAVPVERGAVIDAGDLQVVHVSGGDGLARIDPEEVDQVTGRVAVVDLAPGMLVTDAVAMEPDDLLGPSDGVVGLPLDPGAYPAFDLAVGDMVNVVQVGGSVGPLPATEPVDETATGEEGDESEVVDEDSDTASVPQVPAPVPSSDSPVVASDAEVIQVQELAGGERRLVTLRLPVADAELVASLDSASLQLVQVAP
jgi:hypothetical protein